VKPFLSKSKYLAGLQCPKLLWYHYNSREDIPEPDEATHAIFDAGHVIGNYAKQIYPDAVEVSFDNGFQGTLDATAELLPLRKPVFEASVLVDRSYCAADILIPVGDDAWDLIEVKSGTRTKPENLEDLAFQASCLGRAGLRLERLSLMHVDNSYVREGEIDPNGLLRVEDVTADVVHRIDKVPGRIRQLLSVVEGPVPNTPIGQQCSKPYECSLKQLCWDFLPAHPVTEMYLCRGNKAFDMISQGVCRLADAPQKRLTERQLIQQRVVTSGQPHVDPGSIRAWLDELEFPLYCLDFETIYPAVPLFDGTRPYQQIPFQFSLHVLEAWDSEPKHFEFLATDQEDPRRPLIDGLRTIGSMGTILAYNIGFEIRRIRELALSLPECRELLEGLIGRFRDLATPFQRFWYYHPDQKGSCSLKAILPVLTGESYDNLPIGDGGSAAREFLRVIHKDPTAVDREGVLKHLREYCCQDTRVMVDILNVLRRIA
jgi:hypothetical protein